MRLAFCIEEYGRWRDGNCHLTGFRREAESEKRNEQNNGVYRSVSSKGYSCGSVKVLFREERYGRQIWRDRAI